MSEAFDDGCFADARLADQHRVVLGAAGQDLDGAADFLIASDHRIEGALARHHGEITGIFPEGVIAIFGSGAVRLASLAHRVDGAAQIPRRDAGVGENPGNPGAPRHDTGEQDPFGGDETVAGLFGQLIGGLEQALGFRSEVDLAGARSLHLRHFPQRRLERVRHLRHIAAGAGDQFGRQAFLVGQQNLEQMLGRDLLVAHADGQGLGRMNESTGAFGEPFKLHSTVLRAARRPLWPGVDQKPQRLHGFVVYIR